VATAILIGWVVSLFWMVQRSYFPSKVPESTDWPVPPGAAYFAIKLGDTQVGFSSTNVDTLPEGIGVQQITRIDLPRRAGTRGPVRRLVTRTEALLTRSLRLRSWHTALLDGEDQATMEGRVEGDTAMIVVNRWASGVDTLRTQLSQPILLPVAVPFAVVQRRPLHAGQSLRVVVLDPVGLELAQVETRLTAESLFTIPDSAVYDSAQRQWIPARSDPVRAWRMETLEHGLPVSRWIDGQGLIVRTATPLGLDFERSAFEVVTLNYRNRRPSQIVGAWPTGIAEELQTSAMPETPGAVLQIRLERRGTPVSADAVPALGGGGQRAHADTLFLSRVVPSGEISLQDSLIGPSYLGDALLLQLREARLQALAKSLKGGTPPVMAGRIGDWMNRSVALSRAGPGRPGALYTSMRREGDPACRALLYISLARADGIPARLASGLVRSGDGFHLDSWPEVWLGDWVPVDLRAGRLPADPNRIRLAIGGAGRSHELVPLFGAVTVHIVSQPPPP